MKSDRIRILVVDDHPVVRRGMRHLLGTCSDMEVVGEAPDGSTALRSAAALEPDVVLLDIRMPGSSGFEIVPQLRQISPSTRVIILTTYDDDEYLAKAIGGGAYGYILKSASDETVAEAIRSVYRGDRLVTPSLMGKVLERFKDLNRSQARLETGLTDAELQVLQLLADGATNKQVASKLFISQRTVKRRIQSILKKLNVSHRAQAVIEATKRGVI
jgi:DNA-binding NarL/FixJ family response regulator